MKMTVYAVLAACGLFAGCAHETLHLSRESRTPEFFHRLAPSGHLHTAKFCFSDWGGEPFAVVEYFEPTGVARRKKLPIVWRKHPQYLTVEGYPSYMAILGAKELYRHRKDCHRLFEVIDEEEISEHQPAR